jgi:hypothetical protein
MNLRLLAACAAGMAFAASTASAAITVDHKVANQLYGLDSGQVIIDFDGLANPNVSYTGTVRPSASLPFEDPISTSAPPPYVGPGAATTHDGGNTITVDPTEYASVQQGETGVLSLLNGFYLTSFSFYMGSPDEYNHVTFHLLGGGSQTFDGNQIWGGSPSGNGDRTAGYRVYYNFGGAKVDGITFSTETTNAFEFDGLAGGVAVPEPASWAMMIMGFGAMGGLLRSRRRLALA